MSSMLGHNGGPSMLDDGLPSDKELLQHSGPLKAFDAYSYTNSDGETAIKKRVRDRINDHMEDRGLSTTTWQGGYDDIPDGGVIAHEAYGDYLPSKDEQRARKRKMMADNGMLEGT